MFRIANIFYMCNFWTLSPSHGLGRASPLPEGALLQHAFFDKLKAAEIRRLFSLQLSLSVVY